MLKCSFDDLDLEGMHEFSGTVHFVAPNRLRNDTGEHFDEAVYLDYRSNALYALPPLAPGEEVALDALPPKPIYAKDGTPQYWSPANADFGKHNLQEAAATVTQPFLRAGLVFAGLSDGPALPVELSAPHQRNVHSLIVVALEQP
jgi:hypothetical protein